MTTTRDLLLRQKAQLEAQLPELEATQFECRQAWAVSVANVSRAKLELRKIELALQTVEAEEARTAKPKIMDAVLESLSHHPEGMTALEILADINARHFEGEIVRTSLSPQLSRLKDRDHKITLRGNRWFLLAEEQPSLFKRKV
jgi:hypothetical protein